MAVSTDVVSDFLSVFDALADDGRVERRSVRDAVERILDEARAEHGELPAELRTSFAEELAVRVREADVSVLEFLGAVRGADLWLAHACAAGDARAIKAFSSRYDGDVRLALRGVRVAAMDVDDLAQEMARKMFAGPKPKIVEYSGRGDLRAWVRVVAMRLALTFVRVKRGSEYAAGDDPRLDALEASPQENPDQAYLRRRYRKEVTEAISAAARELDVESRNALHEHYVRGLTVDQIAAVRGIHRATAARRVQRAREALVECVRQVLDRDYGVQGTDLVSVMGLVRSQIHLSMDRVLG